MDSKKFNTLVDGFRKQLEAENLDYVMVIVNHQESQPAEGIVGIHADNGIDVPADMLFRAAKEGEQAPQHFIERLLFDVFSSLNKVIRRKKGNSGNNQSNILN